MSDVTYETAAAQAERLDALVRTNYERDLRFRRMVDGIVGRVLSEHGGVDPEEADRQAADIATRAAALMLAAIYDEDAELLSLKQEVAQLREMAEMSMTLKPAPFWIAKPAS